jgi:hypothetical protein
MTEDEWNDCTVPTDMLEFIQNKVSERKLQLFVSGCARRVWYRFRDARSKRAIEVTEQYADGAATREELTTALADAEAAWTIAGTIDWVPTRLAVQVAGVQTWEEAADVALSTATAHGPTMRGRTLAYTVDLLRDLVGNPFPPQLRIDPAWLVWNDSMVTKLAQDAYEQRSLSHGTLDGNRLAVLGDALEEAGCTDAQLLGHLRAGGPHVRGCFALDAVLGKS